MKGSCTVLIYPVECTNVKQEVRLGEVGKRILGLILKLTIAMKRYTVSTLKSITMENQQNGI